MSTTILRIAAAVKHQARIAAKLASAVAALRVADVKLGHAAEAFNEEGQGRLNARHFADQLASDQRPALTPRVFAALANHDNEKARNLPHVEGAILALMLAQRSLRDALEMAQQVDGEWIDPRCQLIYAAHGTIRCYVSALNSSVLVFKDDDALDAILSGTRTLALAA